VLTVPKLWDELLQGVSIDSYPRAASEGSAGLSGLAAGWSFLLFGVPAKAQWQWRNEITVLEILRRRSKSNARF